MRLLALGLGLFVSSISFARSYCWDANYCHHGMTLYNQNDPMFSQFGLLPNGPAGSQICSPIAGGMMIHGVMMTTGLPAHPGSWTRTYIYGQPYAHRIVYLSWLMGTNPYTGTPWAGQVPLSHRGWDFPWGGG